MIKLKARNLRGVFLRGPNYTKNDHLPDTIIVTPTTDFQRHRGLIINNLKYLRGTALLELALLVPIILTLLLSMLILGQVYMASSEVKTIVDESLKSFVLTDSRDDWPVELTALADGISTRLMKLSVQKPPQIIIAMAKTDADRILIINAISEQVGAPSWLNNQQTDGSLPHIQELNSTLVQTILQLRPKQHDSIYPDLTGFSLTKVTLYPNSLPSVFGSTISWPSVYQRLSFINKREQF